MTYFFLRITAISFLFIMGFKQDSACWAGSNKYAAIVVDGNTGKIMHAENAYDKRHPASLTKKMTLYIIFEALKAGKITLNTRFPVSFLATRQIPSKLGLRVGDSISVEAIIKGMVTKSANDAAIVIAEGLSGSVSKFVQLMNRKAKQLGMNSTQFFNPSGVPDRRQITTAMDMAILAQALHQDFPEHYHYFKTKSFNYLGVSHRNHNHMLGKVEGLDGIKTGFVCASGFNISTSAIRYDTNNKPRRLFAVVMGGTSWRSRDKRTAELLEANFRKIGATSAKPPKFLPAPGTKGIASKKVKKKQADTELIELNDDLKENVISKDSALLEASLREKESFAEQQQPSFQDDEETRNRSAMMQSTSYTPPTIYPSQAQQYTQSTTYITPQSSADYYSTPSYPAYANEAHSQTQSSDQMFDYLKGTESNQIHKSAKSITQKTTKKEKPSKDITVSTSAKKELPSQWVIPKPPSYKEISLSPAKKVNSVKKAKGLSRKTWKNAKASRKKSI
ncbi:MAG: D-alanyl-D-alanine carboxypeptidase [Alphaproteobacteria bacterium]|nr:D-alanyl-D-alanine carboxypeptidase [Alphaproteobacteria bacterium]